MTGEVHDGFWLPAEFRERLLRDVEWETVRVGAGSFQDAGAPGEGEAAGAGGSVTVRWPRLPASRWHDLLAALQTGRRVGGGEAAARWQAALGRVLGDLARDLPARLPVLAAATGYTPAMLGAALAGGDLIDPGSLAAAAGFSPPGACAAAWVPNPAAGGRVRFFPRGAGALPAGWPRRRRAAAGADALHRPAPPADLTLGFAAGNVPGTAFVMALLGSLACHGTPGSPPAPAVLVRNSRHEPLFTPWVLSAVERVDPGLVAATAVLVWDYEDPALQARLLRGAGLLLAAADDTTIAALDGVRAREAPHLRFHRHGHKVSFSALGAGWAAGTEAPRLAALDSSLWDQNGCLSARVHFVEGDAAAYAEALGAAMRELAAALPRGATPARVTHRAYDGYAALAGGGEVRLFSSYDDPFAVVLDGRAWRPESLRRAVNVCQGRVVVVRPVRDVMDVPVLLRALSPSNLQSMSLWLDDVRLEPFATAAGARGVTALRPLGRGAFPQLAQSWDGLLPADLWGVRPDGHFTSIEPGVGTAAT